MVFQIQCTHLKAFQAKYLWNEIIYKTCKNTPIFNSNRKYFGVYYIRYKNHKSIENGPFLYLYIRKTSDIFDFIKLLWFFDE